MPARRRVDVAGDGQGVVKAGLEPGRVCLRDLLAEGSECCPESIGKGLGAEAAAAVGFAGVEEL